MAFVGKRHVLLVGLLLYAVQVTTADSWPGAVIKEVFSESREHFVRVVPGDSVGDTWGFAGAKKGKYAVAEVYRRDKNRSYLFVREIRLLNPVAPVEFFVSNHGHLVTLDNWHNVGYGKVVSLYGPDGNLVRSYELGDLFSSKEIEDFPRSVSSIRWHDGPAYIRQDQKTLMIQIKPNDGGTLVFGLDAGDYKYCEYQSASYRCRNANADRQWLPNAKMSLKD